MTQIITRYFAEADAAQRAMAEMVQFHRFSPRIIHIWTDASQLAGGLGKKQIAPATVQAYAQRLTSGGAVICVEAGYKPLRVAQTTRELTAELGAIPLDGVDEEVWVKDPPQFGGSILSDHPLLMTPRRDPGSTNYYMANWPIPLINRRKPSTQSLFPRHARMASWPIGPLLPGHVRDGSIPIGLLVPSDKYMAKFPFAHIVPGHKFMAKFPFGHLVPGHARMANWPFPLLINGEKHTNSLVPGHKFMAKFPFAHLVLGRVRYGRFPIGLLVPGRKYMAKFPFAHIVPGHRFMAKFPFAHIVPGHKHMANWILPHSKNTAAWAIPRAPVGPSPAGRFRGVGSAEQRLFRPRTIVI